MSEHTEIQWTDATWNPCLGCSKISPGCKGCYAILDVHRMAGNPNPKIAAANAGLTIIEGGHPNWTGKVRLIPERLEIPLHWREPRRVFVNSLSDLFHENLPFEYIDEVVTSMVAADWHTYQILTKRSARMREYFSSGRHDNGVGPDRADYHLDQQIWLGVSVESRDYLSRIDDLRRTPATVRFLSLEPLLEDLGQLDLTGIHWVIVGGESGRDARPMAPEWARNIRDQCEAAGVPYFFKQWGGWSPVPVVGLNGRGVKYADVPVGDGTHHRMLAVPKKKAGRLLDGRTWDEMPQGGRT
jgi:protein gp37